MSERRYQRWDRSQVRQHQAMMVSFSLLVLTGIPLRFADTAVAQLVMRGLGGAATAGLIHRLAAVGLILCCLWHGLYLLRRWRAGTLRPTMLPSREDLRDVVATLRWLVSRRAPEPRYGRYNFIEKFEYYGVLWGSVVMILTGIILWFPVPAAGLVTATGLDLAKVIHGYEAILAALVIALWHMYHAHLRADVFPMNRVWLTGTLSEAEMRHHHPRELEELLADDDHAQETGEPPHADPDVSRDLPDRVDRADRNAADELRPPAGDPGAARPAAGSPTDQQERPPG